MSNGEHIRITVDLPAHEAALTWLRWAERDQLREIEHHPPDGKPGWTAYTAVTVTRLLLADLGIEIPPELEQESEFKILTYWEYGADRFFKPGGHRILARLGQPDKYTISEGSGLFIGAR